MLAFVTVAPSTPRLKSRKSGVFAPARRDDGQAMSRKIQEKTRRSALNKGQLVDLLDRFIAFLHRNKAIHHSLPEKRCREWPAVLNRYGA
jgi:hypothetical protein